MKLISGGHVLFSVVIYNLFNSSQNTSKIFCFIKIHDGFCCVIHAFITFPTAQPPDYMAQDGYGPDTVIQYGPECLSIWPSLLIKDGSKALILAEKVSET